MKSLIQSESPIPGLGLYAKPCPRCGSKMFIRGAPCFLRRTGVELVAKCLNPKCAKQIPVKKKRRARR